MSFEEDKAISTKETEVKNDENNDKQKETTGETKEALEQESKKDRWNLTNIWFLYLFEDVNRFKRAEPYWIGNRIYTIAKG